MSGKGMPQSVGGDVFRDSCLQHGFFDNVPDTAVTVMEIFAAGEEGLILKYENGTWNKQPSPLSDNLNSIKMISPNRNPTTTKYLFSKNSMFGISERRKISIISSLSPCIS